MNSNVSSRWSTVFIASTIVAGIAWLSLFPPSGWGITWWEDHTNFTILSLLFLGLLFFFFNKPRLMVVAFAGCGFISLVLNERIQQPLVNSLTEGEAFPFRIGHFSLQSSDINTDSLFKLIKQAKGDLIAIQDIAPDLFPRIHEFMVSQGYNQFQVIAEPAGYHREMAVYSRHNLEYASLTSQQEVPAIFGLLNLTFNDTVSEFLFIVANLKVTPSSGQLYQLTRRLHLSQLPVIVLGDFNRVSWSSDIQAFKQSSGLLDSRRQNPPTTSRGQLTILDKPKSHIFYSQHFKCLSFETISGLGIVGTYQFIKNGRKNYAKKTAQKFWLRF